MPGGKVHFWAGMVALIPAAAAVAGWYYTGPLAVAVALPGYIVGTIWLSPDLDLVSQPYMAWGPLRMIWWPYMMLVPHRSWLSHGPVVGTLARTAVLAAYAAIVVGVLMWRGVITPAEVRSWLSGDLWPVYAVLAGLETSALVHIALDHVLEN